MSNASLIAAISEFNFNDLGQIKLNFIFTSGNFQLFFFITNIIIFCLNGIGNYDY